MKCGLGNWKEVSDQYVKTKSPKDCEEHYYTFYFRSKEEHLPNQEDYIILQRYHPATSTRGGTLSQNSDFGGASFATLDEQK